MCSELGWGLSCEIADIHTMSVVYTFWNVLECIICFVMNLHVLERFGLYYVFVDEFTFWNVLECIMCLFMNLYVLERFGMCWSV